MTRRDVLLLRAAALWTVFVWAVFLRNMLFGNTDRSVGFKVVHSVLAVVSIVFAAAIWSVAARSRQRQDGQAATRS